MIGRRDSARVVIGVAKRSRRGVDDMDKKRIEIHICPILMRTVRFEGKTCLEKCNNRDDCPIMIEMQRQEEDKCSDKRTISVQGFEAEMDGNKPG